MMRTTSRQARPRMVLIYRRAAYICIPGVRARELKLLSNAHRISGHEFVDFHQPRFSQRFRHCSGVLAIVWSVRQTSLAALCITGPRISWSSALHGKSSRYSGSAIRNGRVLQELLVESRELVGIKCAVDYYTRNRILEVGYDNYTKMPIR